MIGLGFFLFFLVVLCCLDKIFDKVYNMEGNYWFFELLGSAIPAVLIELGFRNFLKAWPFN